MTSQIIESNKESSPKQSVEKVITDHNEQKICTESDKIGSIIGTVISLFIGILFISFGIWFMVIKWNSKNNKGEIVVDNNNSETITNRFIKWFESADTFINSHTILAILAAGVIIGFNSFIMTPLITMMFHEGINNPIKMPGRQNLYINPGQFLISLIGFIFSLMLFFTLGEMFRNKSIKNFFIFIIFSVILAGIIYSIYFTSNDLKNKLSGNCEVAHVSNLNLESSNDVKNELVINHPVFGIF